MGKKTKHLPSFTLRSRLNEKVRRDSEWHDFNLPHLDTSRRMSPLPWLFSLFKEMHAHLYIKLAVIGILLVTVILAGANRDSWGAPVINAARYVTGQDIDLTAMREKVAPVFDRLFENWQLPAFQPAEPPPVDAFLPLSGVIKSGFGMRENPASGKAEMHYGVDLTAQAGTPVLAVLDGRVVKVEDDRGTGTVAVLLDHGSHWQTLYQGLVGVAVREGDQVKATDQLGRLGEPRLWNQSHLHFELRYKGHPVSPPSDWLTLFGEKPL